jgi:hypothetical protein
MKEITKEEKMKTGRVLVTALMLILLATGAHAYTWDQIVLENTYGTGDKTALLVVDFSSGPDDSFAWKVNFLEQSLTAIELTNIVADADADFTLTESGGWLTQITYGEYSGTDSWWMYDRTYDLGETWPDYGDVSDGQGIGWKSGTDAFTFSPETPTVPIPASVLLLSSGLLGLFGIRRRKN